MSDRPRRSDVVLLGAVGAAVCCGLPLLLGAGAAVTIAGVGLRSWLLVAVGAMAIVAGYAQWRQRRWRDPPLAPAEGDNVKAVVEGLKGGADDAGRFTEKVRWAAFDRLCAGQAAFPADLAADLGVPENMVCSTLGGLAAAGLVEFDDRGEVIGAHGITRLPTPHALTLAGTQLHTWCALDAIGIPAALDADAEVSTVCGWCSRRLTLTIIHGVPEAAPRLVLWLPAAPLTNVLKEFCPLANLFCERTQLDRWRRQTDEPDGEVVTVAEAAELGRSLWRRDHVGSRDAASDGG